MSGTSRHQEIRPAVYVLTGENGARQVLQIELATSGWRALEEPRSSGAVRGVGAGINAVGPIPHFLDLLDLDFFLVAPGLQHARP